MTVAPRLRSSLAVLALVASAGFLLPLHAQDPAADPAAAFFDDTSLQEIRLRIHTADWTQLQENFQSNTYYPCDLVWRDQVVPNVGIRSRGLGSRNQRKPGLRVDFDRYSTDQAFLGLKSFVLDNLTQDPSGLKETLTMKLFRRRDVPAPQEAHVKLYVNDTYIGLYAMAEAVDKRFLRLMPNLDADGYLFEYNWLDTWFFTHRGDSLEAYQALFSAKTHEKDAISSVYPAIEQFVRTANASTDFAREIATYLDAQAFLRFLAIEQYLAENDGLTGYAGMNNFYLYRTPTRTEFKFIAWDKDNTFYSADRSVFQGTNDNVLVRRLLEVPEYRDHFIAMVRETAASADEPQGDASAPTWLQQELERQYALTNQAMREDPSKPFSNDQYDAAIETLRAFVQTRGSIVRSELP